MCNVYKTYNEILTSIRIIKLTLFFVHLFHLLIAHECRPSTIMPIAHSILEKMDGIFQSKSFIVQFTFS